MFATLRVIVGMSITGGGFLVAAFFIGRGDLLGASLAWGIGIAVVALGFISQFASFGLGLHGLGSFLRIAAIVLAIVAFVLAWKVGVASLLGGLGGAFIGGGFADILTQRRLAAIFQKLD